MFWKESDKNIIVIKCLTQIYIFTRRVRMYLQRAVNRQLDIARKNRGVQLLEKNIFSSFFRIFFILWTLFEKNEISWTVWFGETFLLKSSLIYKLKIQRNKFWNKYDKINIFITWVGPVYIFTCRIMRNKSRLRVYYSSTWKKLLI